MSRMFPTLGINTARWWREYVLTPLHERHPDILPEMPRFALGDPGSWGAAFVESRDSTRAIKCTTDKSEARWARAVFDTQGTTSTGFVRIHTKPKSFSGRDTEKLWVYWREVVPRSYVKHPGRARLYAQCNMAWHRARRAIHTGRYQNFVTSEARLLDAFLRTEAAKLPWQLAPMVADLQRAAQRGVLVTDVLENETNWGWRDDGTLTCFDARADPVPKHLKLSFR